MIPRSLADARRWMQQGTTLLAKQADLDDDALNAPSALPGWTRKHLLAHVAGNADALSNLVRWAATGKPTPMYSSPVERAAGIAHGSRMPARDLTTWLRSSADALEEAMIHLSEEQWQTPVVTAQGRTVPATEVPWLRSREVYVHAVDLATGLSFADLPSGFLLALCADVVGKRGTLPGPPLMLVATDTAGQWELPGQGNIVTLSGPLAEITAYLTGRTHNLASTDYQAPPTLPAWL